MVLVSTHESLKNREISFLAIVEIIVAVWIYWGISVYFDTYIHFLISIVLTPILLLSSKYSKRKGIYLLNQWTKISKDTLKPEIRGIMMLITMIITMFLTFILSQGSINILQILFIIILTSLVTSFLLLLFTGKESERMHLLGRQSLAMFMGIIYGLLLNAHWYTAMFILFFITIIIYNFNKNNSFSVFFSILFFLNPISLYISTVLVTYTFTVYSIIKTLKKSFLEISDNWKYNLLIIDFKKYPELMPNIELSTVDILKFSTYVKGIGNDNIFKKILRLIIIGVLFFPAILYRLSIKSTFWFYIPLLFVIKSPNLDTSKHIGKFLSELYETALVKVRGLLALISIIAFLITHFNFYSFKEVDSPFVSILSLLYFDFSSLEMWKIFQLLVALLTVGLFFYANAIRVPNVSNNIPLQNDVHIKTIFYLNSIRNWLSLFYLLSAFIFLATYLKVWEYEYVPNFLKSFFTTLLEYVRYVPFN